jgi:hypothetical protein
MPTLDVNDSTLRMLNELTESTHVPVQDLLNRAVTEFRRQTLPLESPNAPDGLPWPEGYFESPPKKTLEEATAEYGVRPRIYFKGWPLYSTAETNLPEFKVQLPDEPPEVLAEWASWEKSEPHPVEPAGA